MKSGALIDREVIYHVQLQINVTDVNGVVNVPQTDSGMIKSSYNVKLLLFQMIKCKQYCKRCSKITEIKKKITIKK